MSAKPCFSEVTNAEVIEASGRIPLGKVSGSDGVPDLVVKQIATYKPEMLRDLFNACLRKSMFPKKWKVAKLVLLRKGDMSIDNPKSYRPICLPNTIGKLFEHIIKAHLENHMESTSDLNTKQFGFSKGRSTIDAMETVMGVVENTSTRPLYNR